MYLNQCANCTLAPGEAAGNDAFGSQASPTLNSAKDSLLLSPRHSHAQAAQAHHPNRTPQPSSAMQKRQRAARASGAVLSSSGGLRFGRFVVQDDLLDMNLALCRYSIPRVRPAILVQVVDSFEHGARLAGGTHDEHLGRFTAEQLRRRAEGDVGVFDDGNVGLGGWISGRDQFTSEPSVYVRDRGPV